MIGARLDIVLPTLTIASRPNYLLSSAGTGSGKRNGQDGVGAELGCNSVIGD